MTHGSVTIAMMPSTRLNTASTQKLPVIDAGIAPPNMASRISSISDVPRGSVAPQIQKVSPPSAIADHVTANTKVNRRIGNAISPSNTRSSQRRGSASVFMVPSTPR